MKRSIFHCALVLLLLAPATVSAQKESPKHTYRILFLDAAANAPETLYLFDGQSSEKVELPQRNFSPVYELRPGALNISLLPGPLNDPKQLPAGTPSAVVAEDMVDFYLLVTSDSKNPVAPVRLQVINASSEKLKPGQMLWFNLTTNTVGGTLGSEKLKIQPGTRLVMNPPMRASGNYPVALYFSIPNDNHLYPLCETYWRHDPASRSLVFVTPVEGSRSPRVRGICDYRDGNSGHEPK